MPRAAVVLGARAPRSDAVLPTNTFFAVCMVCMVTIYKVLRIDLCDESFVCLGEIAGIASHL